MVVVVVVVVVVVEAITIYSKPFELEKRVKKTKQKLGTTRANPFKDNGNLLPPTTSNENSRKKNPVKLGNSERNTYELGKTR